MNIMIIDDEPKIAQILADYLHAQGHHTTLIHDGRNAVERIRQENPDFLILDIMLPGKDGLTICQEVRRFSQVPIMMLTAKVDEAERLSGLEHGADDYVCKPFSPREVIARIRAITRRVQSPQTMSPQRLRYRAIELHLDQYECHIHGQRVDLTPVEFKLLRHLATHPGRVFSRDKLMDASYSDGRIVSDRTIDTHIKNLRKKLLESNQKQDLIHSIYGIGYKLE